jgi:nucleotide-binding universal stress UspA family protein
MGIFSSILVPIDGSRPAEVGTALATALAKEYGGKLTFVNIVDVGALATTSDYAAVDAAAIADEAHDIGERLAQTAVTAARAEGLQADGKVLDGPIVDRLLDAITESGATVVVMGSHGRGGLSRALFGSTTEVLLRRSPIPVLVAPRGR